MSPPAPPNPQKNHRQKLSNKIQKICLLHFFTNFYALNNGSINMHYLSITSFASRTPMTFPLQMIPSLAGIGSY